MSTLSLSTDTFNLFPASPASHILRFERMPFLSFTVQEVSLPGVSANPARVARSGVGALFAPDKLTYEPLSVTFLVDEELRVHQEVHRWMSGMTGREDRTRLTATFRDEQAEYVWGAGSDPSEYLATVSRTHAGLTIVNEAKIPLLRILFYNAYPINIGPIQYSVTQDPDTVLTSTATFEYDYYSIVDIRR